MDQGVNWSFQSNKKGSHSSSTASEWVLNCPLFEEFPETWVRMQDVCEEKKGQKGYMKIHYLSNLLSFAKSEAKIIARKE